jgi:hypothetical protein
MNEEQNEETKQTIYLILALLIISGFIGFREFYLKENVEFSFLPNLLPVVQINYDVLRDERLEEFKPFEEIVMPEEVGRENPFEIISD